MIRLPRSTGPRLLRLLFALAGALPWLLVLAPELESGLQPAFRAFCHQMPERTLAFGGHPMVICSRCAGIYGGLALAALVPALPVLARQGRRWVLAALALMALDVLLQDLGLHPASHPVRLITGFLVGWTAAAFLLALLNPGGSPDA